MYEIAWGMRRCRFEFEIGIQILVSEEGLDIYRIGLSFRILFLIYKSLYAERRVKICNHSVGCIPPSCVIFLPLA
jgi:hypothetical protein